MTLKAGLAVCVHPSYPYWTVRDPLFVHFHCKLINSKDYLKLMWGSNSLRKPLLVQNYLFELLSLHCSSARRHCPENTREFYAGETLTLGDRRLMCLRQTAEASHKLLGKVLLTYFYLLFGLEQDSLQSKAQVHWGLWTEGMIPLSKYVTWLLFEDRLERIANLSFKMSLLL